MSDYDDTDRKTTIREIDALFKLTDNLQKQIDNLNDSTIKDNRLIEAKLTRLVTITGSLSEEISHMKKEQQYKDFNITVLHVVFAIFAIAVCVAFKLVRNI